MAQRKSPPSKSGAGKSAAAKKSDKGSTGTTAADGYQGLSWDLYKEVRPGWQYKNPTGPGLVEYTLWFEVIKKRPQADKHDKALPGQAFH
jgi:hypothetical protein